MKIDPMVSSPSSANPSPSADRHLIDTYGRILTYMRVSVTDRCNLRCRYCVPRTGFSEMGHLEILRYEELLRLIRVGISLGLKKVRITGGEPLVRRGIEGFIRQVSDLPGIAELALTTNGLCLEKNLLMLRDAGVRRLNISLDTLDPEVYRHLTGVDGLATVLQAIHAAHRMGFAPIKINAVALRGINDQDIPRLARLALEYPWHIRFIEYMPIGESPRETARQMLVPEIKRLVESLGTLTSVAANGSDGPAQRYRWADAPGEVGFISAVSHHFCENCNRLRLTASGRLRACLLADHSTDLKGPLREGCTDDTLRALFLETCRKKPRHHKLKENGKADVGSPMKAIGG